MTILITGGTGYIGSHVAVEAIMQGCEVVLLDNFSNSQPDVLYRIERMTGCKIKLYEGNCGGPELLETVFSSHSFKAVMHFAGYKSVSESCDAPLEYYENNLFNTLQLCKKMAAFGVFKMVFSSSATVYAEDDCCIYREDFDNYKPSSPYGRSKRFTEEVLADIAKADPRWSFGILRYFNPVGAHPTSLIGENPLGTPNNLMPFIAKVAAGKLSKLLIFGGDYDTVDGTGVRDYIHVMDVADGHLKALDFLSSVSGMHTWNLGTGKGHSVLEMVAAFESVCDRKIPYSIVERRSGDRAQFWADVEKAKIELRWEARRTIGDMMQDAWNWQKASEKF